ncbi:endonuclease [Phaeovulum sp. NW3]|uniref:endonuclease n=1 Tax=Phaeovulum sp. NW3 TaxID=2934933 RepID=UPI0020209108|nr:endonuclease [Phaeovulum sp. NW3]MCL7465375.1 endonuclease [Phaeovulum sp. NW3]
MTELDNGCRGKSWAAGAIAGLVVFGFVLASHAGFVAALFLGLVTAGLFGSFLVWGFCQGRLAAPLHAAPVTLTPAPAAAEPVPPQAAAPTPAEVPASAAPAPVTEQAPAEIKAPAKTKAAAKAKAPAKVKAQPVAEGGKKPRAMKAPRKAGADDLKKIEGIGTALEKACNGLGIWHYDQIAKWGEAEVAWMDANLKGFRGRVSRDKWVAQAKIIVEEGLDRFLERAKTNDY